MTRLLAIGDVHLHQNERQALRLKALDQIVSEASEISRLGAWCIAGDLFHAKSTSADRNALADRLQRLADLAPGILTRGNHDANGELDIFAKLKAAHPVYVVTSPQTLRLTLATGERATVAILPYPERGGLVGAGVAHGDLVQTAAALLDPIFMTLAHEIDQARAAGDLVWFMGHVNIAGSRSSAGQPLVGAELEITRAHMDRLGPILKVVNHVHLPQEIHGAIYPGSIAPMDWAETHDCRFLVVDLQADSSFTVGAQRLDVPALFHVEGRLTRDGFTLAKTSDDETRRRFLAGDWDDVEVRVRFTYKASERAALDDSVIREAFKTALRLKVESVAEADRDVRAPAVARATTLVDKLAAMRPDGTLPAAVAEKVALLEQRDGADVLAAVDAWVAEVEAPERAMEAVA